MTSSFAQHRQAMANYLSAFSNGDLDTLLEKAKGTVFALKAAFAGEESGSAAVLFEYRKPKPGGGMQVFDCVDIFSFDAAGKIKELWIIFDTKNL